MNITKEQYKLLNASVEKVIKEAIGESFNYYLIVYLDESNLSFSVEPYDGEIFNK